MNKYIAILITIFLVFALAYFSQDIINKLKPQPKKQSTQIKKFIEDILTKAQNLGSLQYEVNEVITVNPPGKIELTWDRVTTKTWQELPYIRWELILAGKQNKIIISIERPDGIYSYDSSRDDKFHKSSFPGTIHDFTPIKVLLKEIETSKTLKELGTEVVDGKLSTVIEFDYIYKGTSGRRKVWIWNEKGIPIKVESTEPSGWAGVVELSKAEFKNFKFGDISDSVFEVPKDKVVEVLSSSSN